VDEVMLWQFLESTQAKELAKLHHKPDWKRQVLERLHRKLKKDGILAVLKKGLEVDNAHLRPALPSALQRPEPGREGGL
jgi:type I restriction enzyme R subunit